MALLTEDANFVPRGHVGLSSHTLLRAVSRMKENELREEVQAGRLRKQSSERRRQAASRCGQEQLHGEVHKECLERWCGPRARRLL
jgi:hypothetical protein